MKAPKPKRMYDLTILRMDNGIVYHDATPVWNKPFLIIRFILRTEKNNPRFELKKGQFFYPVPNSKDPLDYYRTRKKKQTRSHDQKLRKTKRVLPT